MTYSHEANEVLSNADSLGGGVHAHSAALTHAYGNMLHPQRGNNTLASLCFMFCYNGYQTVVTLLSRVKHVPTADLSTKTFANNPSALTHIWQLSHCWL